MNVPTADGLAQEDTMRNRLPFVLAAAAFALSGAALSQSADVSSPAKPGASNATTAASAPSDRRLRARLKPAAGNAANATGRDLSDGSASPAAGAGSTPSGRASPSSRVRPSGGASRRDGANATGRDLSDSDPQGLTSVPSSARAASGSQRDRRRAGARVGDTSNSPSRDLSDSSFPSTPASGARGK